MLQRKPQKIAATVMALTFAVAGCGSSGAASAGSGSDSGAGTANKGQPIKVGMAVGLTGYLSENDKPLTRGAKMAVNQINSHGGIDGHKVKLVVRDMASNASQGVSVTHELIARKNIDVMVNGFTSAATKGEAPVLAGAKIPAVVASILPPSPKWVFSTFPPTKYYAQAQLGYAKQKGAKRVAVMYSQTPYGQNFVKNVKQQANSLGLKVVNSLAISSNSTNLSTQIAKVRNANADVIIDALTGPVHLVLAKNAAAANLNIPIVMGVDTLDVFKKASDVYPHVAFLANYPQVYPHIQDAAILKANKEFIPKYRKAYGSKLVNNAARGWDAVHILAKAVQNSGAITGPKLRDALAHVTFTGTSAKYHYSPDNHDGLSTNPMVIAKYSASKVKVVYRPNA